jgi:hypothetical protein
VYGIVQPGSECPGGVPFVQSRDVGGAIDVNALQRTSPEIARQYRRSKIATGDILFSLRGNIGQSSITPTELEGANIARGVARIRVGAKSDPEFVRYVLQGPELQRIIARNANGSTFRELSIEEIRKLPIPDVSLLEQRKIAEILRTWDKALERLTALRAAKVRRISSLRQRLFEEEYSSHNRLQRAKDLFETVSERGRTDLPLLAVMQDIGIVRRDELDRRVAMPDGDTSTYKVVRPGDFVISLRSFEGGRTKWPRTNCTMPLMTTSSTFCVTRGASTCPWRCSTISNSRSWILLGPGSRHDAGNALLAVRRAGDPVRDRPPSEEDARDRCRAGCFGGDRGPGGRDARRNRSQAAEARGMGDAAAAVLRPVPSKNTGAQFCRR